MKRDTVLFWVSWLASASVTGCGPEGESSQPAVESLGPLMRPGENCLRCHSAFGQAAERPWSAAGTVYRSLDANAGMAGVRVVLTDSVGKKIELTTNQVGNFYTPEPLQAPYHVRIEYQGHRQEMPIPVPAGSCNFCHSHPGPSGDAKGRIFIGDP